MAGLTDHLDGIGMTSSRTRARMVERLREQGVRDEQVLAAMGRVPRHIFVDEALASRAYDDTSLPIGFGQTISQPWVVARLVELARAGRELGRVLEIGSGCGYQAAVIAQLAREVFSLERIGGLAVKARRHLAQLGVRNVRIRHADASRLPVATEEFDAIVVAAGTSFVPAGWPELLRMGGRLVLPLGRASVQEPAKHDPRERGLRPGPEDESRAAGEQRLVVIERRAAGFHRSEHESVRFVPLLSGLR